MLTILVIDHPLAGRTVDILPLDPGESPQPYLEEGVTLVGTIPCDTDPIAHPMVDAVHVARLAVALELLEHHILYDAEQGGQEGTVYDALRRMLALTYEAGYAHGARQHGAPAPAGDPPAHPGKKKRRAP